MHVAFDSNYIMLIHCMSAVRTKQNSYVSSFFSLPFCPCWVGVSWQDLGSSFSSNVNLCWNFDLGCVSSCQKLDLFLSFGGFLWRTTMPALVNYRGECCLLWSFKLRFGCFSYSYNWKNCVVWSVFAILLFIVVV